MEGTAAARNVTAARSIVVDTRAAIFTGTARMLAAYPVVPLAKRQALSIGLTSYDGKVFYGLNADRDAMPDVDVLAQCLADSLAELLETVR